MKIKQLQPVFVDSFPDEPRDGIIYISMRFRTAMHLCCCGCSTEVVTPIRPTDWSLTYNGESVTLYPSIGNWSLQCRSHYWLLEGCIQDASNWPEERVEAARAFDRANKDAYYGSHFHPSVQKKREVFPTRKSFWSRLRGLLRWRE